MRTSTAASTGTAAAVHSPSSRSAATNATTAAIAGRAPAMGSTEAMPPPSMMMACRGLLKTGMVSAP